MSYPELHARSLADPDTFWRAEARRIEWHRPFETVCDQSRLPSVRWFVGGETNLCHNAVDRHLASQADQPALIWVSTEVDQEKSFTFGQLHREVQRMAARVAIELAEQKIRARLSPEVHASLIQGFVGGLPHGIRRASQS